MKLSTATTALAATVGLSAWSMTAALAVAPAETAPTAPVTAPAEAAPAESAPAESAPEEAAPTETDSTSRSDEVRDLLEEKGLTGETVLPELPGNPPYPATCADAAGTPYEDLVLQEGWPTHLDGDADGIMCESNGDDDDSRALPHDPWEELILPLPEGYEFPNCDTAQAAGLTMPFPVVTHFAGGHLDPDQDFMACESNGDDDAAYSGVVHEIPWLTEPSAPSPEAPETPAPVEEPPADGAAGAPGDEGPAAQAPAADAPAAEAATTDESQVEEVPVGGADTGATASRGGAAMLAGGGLLVLSGAGLLIRRAVRA